MLDDVKIDLTNILQDKDRHGRTRVYYRPPKVNGKRTGRMVRLYAEPGTPEFLDEYQAAVRGDTKPKPQPKGKAANGTLRWLVDGYFQSANFRTLGASTQKARRGILESICLSKTSVGQLERGTLPFAAMRAKHVRAIRDEKIEWPEAANGRLKALGQVFAWAMTEEIADHDPTAGIEYLHGNADGWHTWTVEEVRQYEKRWPMGTQQRLALDVLLYTGVRRSDAVKLGPPMERNGALHFTETKNANSRALSRKGKPPKPKRRVVPILPQLRASIDATRSGHLVYLVHSRGGAWNEASFGNSMRKWCNAAGLPHCSAHGLRKAGATIAADNGATGHQLMAIYGWETLRQAEVYTREADRTRLAAEGMHLVVPRQGNKPGA